MKYTKLERNWVMYDVGNSALVLLNTSVVPIYFNAINTGASSADLVVAWGNAQTIASLVIAMLMPILGALADYAGNKIKFFMGFFLTGLVLCLAQAIPMSAMAFLTVYVLCTIGHIVGGVFSEVGHTMREIAHNKTVLVYMIAFFFYIDGVHTVISMATSYGSALGIDSTQLVLALLVTQFVAFPSAIIYGKLAGRVGTLNMILVAVAAYMGIVLFAAFFLKTAFEFWVLAILVGLFQGGVQALSRSYFGRIIPKEKSNEYYGFFDIFGRYASVMGTFLVSVVTSLTGNPSLGVLSIGVLLVVGFVLLVRLSRMSQTAEQAA